MYPSLILHTAVMIALPLGMWWQRHVLARATSDVTRRVWLGLVALLLIEGALVTAWVPHGSWQTNMHGITRIADVLDEGLFGHSDMGRLHGMGWVVWMRLGHMVTGGLVDVPQLTHLTALGSLVGLFLFLGTAMGRWQAALAATAMLALHPVHLRLAASASPYILVEAQVFWTLLWVELHLRERTAVTWCIAAGWQALAMQTHGEMLVLGPAVAGLYVLCRDPGWIRFAVVRSWFWAGLGLVTVVVAPWIGAMVYGALVDIDVFSATGDMGDSLGRNMVRTSQLTTLGKTSALVLATAGVARWVWPRLTTRARLTWQQSGLTLLVLGGLAWLVPDPAASWGGLVEMRVTPLGDERLSLARVHPFFDPTFGPDPYVALAWLGALALGIRQGWMLVFLVVAGAGCLTVSVGHYDSISTFLRVSMPSLWCLTTLAGLGGTAVMEAAGASRLAGLATMVLALVAGRSHWTWVSHRFPMQQEEDLIFRARALPGVDRLATLSSTDQPDHPGVVYLDFHHRNYVEQALERWRGGQFLDATTLIREPLQPGTYWLKLPTCYRPVTPRAEAVGSSSEVDSQAWWIEGRMVDVPRFDDDGPYDGAYALNPLTQQGYDLDDLVPCRGRPDAMQCAEIAPDDTCLRWVCVEDLPPERPFLDALCAEVEAEFVLEPVFEEALAAGNLSRSRTLVAAPGAIIGLYRVVARREGR